MLSGVASRASPIRGYEERKGCEEALGGRARAAARRGAWGERRGGGSPDSKRLGTAKYGALALAHQ
eukprot:scaffold1111_cov112-Isochrysis_galbana.AAC.4